MPRDATPSLAEQVSAVHDWWREAGVDQLFADEATIWLEDKPGSAEAPKVAKVAAPPPPPPEAKIGGDRASSPADLAQFAQWWLAEPSLDHGGAAPRVPPRGPAGAKLMVLVPEPEKQDSERLLAGDQGNLLASFLKNAGIAEDEVYFAAALPRHTPMADWLGMQRSGLDKVILHHVELVAPERLILFGRDVTALLGHDPAKNPQFLLNFNHQGGSVRALTARSLDHMLRIPPARKRLWQDWLDWTNG